VRPTAPAPVRQRQHRLSPDEVTQLLADYQAGLTVAAVAAKHQVDVKTATKHLTDHGIAIRQKKVAISASEHSTLLELKAAGWSNTKSPSATVAAAKRCSKHSNAPTGSARELVFPG
jgi:hypothetical protein